MQTRLTYVLIFTLIDIVVGTVKSLHNRTWKSSVFRNGLYKKFSQIGIIALAVAIDKYFKDVSNLTFNLFNSACAYVTFMEILSILENFSKTGEISGFVDSLKQLIKGKQGSINENVLQGNSESTECDVSQK